MSRRRDKKKNAKQDAPPDGSGGSPVRRCAMDVVREIAGLVAFFDRDEVVVKGNGRPKDKMVGAIGRLRAACRSALDAARPDYRSVAVAAQQVEEAWSHQVHLWGPKSGIVRQQSNRLFRELDTFPEFNA
ncbi:MAG TPA: hypothetical protein PLP17_05185 [Oligoflexia bacterium]|nr:hypothetical protein [Oligoflexia bacterium]